MKTNNTVLVLLLAVVMLGVQSCKKNTVCDPISVNAGEDATINGSTVTLSALPLLPGQTGTWTVMSGTQGSFDDSASNNASFTGQEEETYVLRWTVSNGCSTTFDEVQVSLLRLVKMKTRTRTTLGGSLLYKEEYFYDAQNRVSGTEFTFPSGFTKYTFTYLANGKVDKNKIENSVISFNRELRYFYQANGKLDKVEQYKNNTLSGVDTYTYPDALHINIKGSSGSTTDVTYEFDVNNDIAKITYNTLGAVQTLTHYADKLSFHPLAFDPADPFNASKHLLQSYTYSNPVKINSTSTYVFNTKGYPTQETLTYPNDGNRQEVVTYTYE
ncbi:hypothetical protein WSM22_39130 [Cytophagales bacterium WSM2-2]|nr:hypothetical protein WSM22_39130 [Cytophagales bacterium WSM2-2]